MQERTRSQMLEDLVMNLSNHAETGQIPKPYRRGSWRPIGEDEYFRLHVTQDTTLATTPQTQVCYLHLCVTRSMLMNHALLSPPLFYNSFCLYFKLDFIHLFFSMRWVYI